MSNIYVYGHCSVPLRNVKYVRVCLVPLRNVKYVRVWSIVGFYRKYIVWPISSWNPEHVNGETFFYIINAFFTPLVHPGRTLRVVSFHLSICIFCKIFPNENLQKWFYIPLMLDWACTSLHCERNHIFYYKREIIYFNMREKSYILLWERNQIFYYEREIIYFTTREKSYILLQEINHIFYYKRDHIFYYKREIIYFTTREKSYILLQERNHIF